MVVMLREGESVRRSVAYAELTWRVDGPGAAAAGVSVTRADGGEMQRGVLRRPSANTIVITSLPAPLVVAVGVLAAAEPFPPTTTVHTSINVAQPDGSREQIVLDAVDVTGLSHQELLQIEPGADGQPKGVEWLLRASAGVEDVALAGLARQAYYAARRRSPRIAPGSVPGAVPTLAVDISASMTSHIRNGTLATLLEIYAGLYAWAFGATALTPLWVFGSTCDRISAGLPAAELAATIAARVAPRPARSGASHSALVKAVGARPAGKLMIISDGVPGDSPRLSATLANISNPLSCSYLLLARSRFDSDELARPAPDRDELSGLTEIPSGVAGVISIDPDGVADLAGDARRLDLLVERLTGHVLG